MTEPIRDRDFFVRDAVDLARDLLGRVLVRTLDDGARPAGRIVETEAYLGEIDAAAHTFGGRRTERNEAMYLPGGHIYVYFTYGMHHCFNITAGLKDEPVAVLIRALEPVSELEVMRKHRAGKIDIKRLKDRDLCSGPAKLCEALRIDRSLNALDLTAEPGLHLEAGRPVDSGRIKRTKRVGVAYAGAWADKPLRFYIRDNPHVSVK